MKTTTLGWIVALGLVGTAFGACSQPKAECQVALASTGYSYAVKYTLKSQPSAACMAAVKPGEQIGMEFYHPPTSDGTAYDSSKTTMAIQSDVLGTAVGDYNSAGGGDPCRSTSPCVADKDCGDATLKCLSSYCVPTSCTDLHQPWALGSFASATPDANDFCSWSGTTTAEQDFTEVDDTAGAGVPVGAACMTDGDCQGVGPDANAKCDTTSNACTYSCMTDADCQALMDPSDPMSGDPASGTVCDATTNTCAIGCRATDTGGMPAANTCAAPYQCTSADATIGKCLLPKTTVKYAWSNVKIYVSATAPGTQFSADLSYTQDNCTVEYTAIGVWPGIPCAVDDDCNPCAEPDAGKTIGSGISPDFPIKCDSNLGLCTLRDAKDLTKDATSIPQFLATSTNCGAVE